MSDDGKKNPWRRKQPIQEDDDEIRVWRILVFGLIGAAATTFMVGRLRRTYDWLYTQLNRSQYWSATSSSNRSSFREEAWKRYNRRMQEEREEEMERVERIRRMQSVFNRERNKYKNTESWGDNGAGAYQHFQRDDWYWKADPTYKDWRANSRATPREIRTHPLSHHYSVLGLDRSRARPYSEAEIKTAFRTKAKEYHPDQNQNNKEAAEAKFKEVMVSYEAIKLERNGKSCSN